MLLLSVNLKLTYLDRVERGQTMDPQELEQQKDTTSDHDEEEEEPVNEKQKRKYIIQIIKLD